MSSILIIDDEEKLRNLMARLIGYEGFEVFEAGDCRSGLKRLEKSDIDVVLCDVKLPDGNGVEMAKTIKEQHPHIEVILLTAYGNFPDGVQAIKNGAFDYIIKGDDNNKIIPLIHRALEKVSLSKRVQQLQQQLGSHHSFDKIIGQSKAIQQAIELAKKVALSDTTVLLTGETGTGKEVFAQAIHHHSSRRSKHFVAINCAAFSKELLESELFGHIAGAFTGATKDQKGLFHEANEGSIFLDEIGEMALDLQAKLLRVIETGEFFRVGESKPSKVNVRIIAATNRNLLEEIKKGNFREDLFYRISVFQIQLPALRERIADIEPLATHFLLQFAIKMNKQVRAFSTESMQALKFHSWKGNIRELKNVIERCVILVDGDEVRLADLPIDFISNDTVNQKGQQLSAFDLALIEKKHIEHVLAYTNGNKTETARLMNIALTTLYRKLEKYAIDCND